MYSERNNQDKYNKNQYDKTRSKVYVVKKQEDNKNTDNNEKAENSLEVKKHEFDYYVGKEFSYHVMNLNINFYEVKFYNHKNKKSEVNFVTILMIQCCDCHQVFDIRNVLFHCLCSESFKIAHCSNRKTKTMLSSTVMLVKFSGEKLLKIVLMSVIIKDIETDYDF